MVYVLPTKVVVAKPILLRGENLPVGQSLNPQQIAALQRSSRLLDNGKLRLVPDPFSRKIKAGRSTPTPLVKQALNVMTAKTLTASATRTPTGLSLAVNGGASAATDGKKEYRWVWGDGASDTTAGATTTHVYAGAGTYTVSLRVVDNNDAVSDAVSYSVTVS